MKINNNKELIFKLFILTGFLSPWLSILGRQLYFFHFFLATIAFYFVIKYIREKHFQNIDYSKFLKLNAKTTVIYLLLLNLFISNFIISSPNIKYFAIYSMLVITILFIVNIATKDSIVSVFSLISNIIFIISLIAILESTTDFRMPFSMYLTRDFIKYSYDKIEYLMTYPTVFYFNPNDLAFVLLSGFALELGISKFKPVRSISVLKMLSIFFALYLTGSRAMLLGVFIILAFAIYFADFTSVKRIFIKQSKKIVIISVITLVILSPLLIRILKEIIDIIVIIASGDFSNSPYHSIRERWSIIVSSFTLISKNIFGYGIGNGSVLVGKMISVENLSLHNWPLEIILDFGLLIFTSIVIAQIYIINSLFKILRSNYSNNIKGIALGLIFIKLSYMTSFIGPSSITYFIPFWIIESCILAFIVKFKEGVVKYESINNSTSV